MLKLAFLLVGPEAFRARWYVLAILGGLFMALAALLAIDAVDGVTAVTQETMGGVFVVNGVLTLLGVLGGGAEGRLRNLALAKAAGLIVLGGLILGFPFKTDIALVVLFSFTFALDGLGRIATANLVRFSGWRMTVAIGIAELLVAVLILTDWPLPDNRDIPFCISLLMALTGWLLVRVSLMFRTLESEAAILLLPIFGGRGWYDNAPVLIDTGDAVKVENPMVVHVWTPVGSAYEPERRLLIDRYIAAVDGNGVISTGHSALEMLPDVYISHYPANEVERSGRDFIQSLRGTADNDLPGRFLPSYGYEQDWWCPADAHVEFRNFNPRRLRAFWIGYRQDSTYNLTNRNCSVVVAAALDAALEGALGSRNPWLRLAGLLINPDLWIATMIRNRAASMTWTPGMVLDYARTMARIVERRELPWGQRLLRFLRRIRPPQASSSKAHTA